MLFTPQGINLKKNENSNLSQNHHRQDGLAFHNFFCDKVSAESMLGKFPFVVVLSNMIITIHRQCSLGIIITTQEMTAPFIQQKTSGKFRKMIRKLNRYCASVGSTYFFSVGFCSFNVFLLHRRFLSVFFFLFTQSNSFHFSFCS